MIGCRVSTVGVLAGGITGPCGSGAISGIVWGGGAGVSSGVSTGVSTVVSLDGNCVVGIDIAVTLLCCNN